jgi:hypothetical protein
MHTKGRGSGNGNGWVVTFGPGWDLKANRVRRGQTGELLPSQDNSLVIRITGIRLFDIGNILIFRRLKTIGNFLLFFERFAEMERIHRERRDLAPDL